VEKLTDSKLLLQSKEKPALVYQHDLWTNLAVQIQGSFDK